MHLVERLSLVAPNVSFSVGCSPLPDNNNLRLNCQNLSTFLV
jgi:hypothetical protein